MAVCALALGIFIFLISEHGSLIKFLSSLKEAPILFLVPGTLILVGACHASAPTLLLVSQGDASDQNVVITKVYKTLCHFCLAIGLILSVTCAVISTPLSFISLFCAQALGVWLYYVQHKNT